MPSKINEKHKSIKYDIIDRTNKKMFLSVAAATFISVFSLFAIRSLISQSLYHSRVIREKEKALTQLQENVDSIEGLKKSYETFESEPINIIGGDPAGAGALDGTNTKVTLDAMPDSYDYPGLSSSFEKILREGGYDIGSIGGTEDDSLASGSKVSPGIVKPVDVPYSFSVRSDTDGTKRLLQTLERSIRPMYVDSLLVQSGDNVLQTRVGLHTFFAPAKTFQLGSKEVK